MFTVAAELKVLDLAHTLSGVGAQAQACVKGGNTGATLQGTFWSKLYFDLILEITKQNN